MAKSAWTDLSFLQCEDMLAGLHFLTPLQLAVWGSRLGFRVKDRSRFRFGRVRIWVRHLVVIVKDKVRGWGMHTVTVLLKIAAYRHVCMCTSHTVWAVADCMGIFTVHWLLQLLCFELTICSFQSFFFQRRKAITVQSRKAIQVIPLTQLVLGTWLNNYN